MSPRPTTDTATPITTSTASNISKVRAAAALWEQSSSSPPPKSASPSSPKAAARLAAGRRPSAPETSPLQQRLANLSSSSSSSSSFTLGSGPGPSSPRNFRTPGSLRATSPGRSSPSTFRPVEHKGPKGGTRGNDASSLFTTRSISPSLSPPTVTKSAPQTQSPPAAGSRPQSQTPPKVQLSPEPQSPPEAKSPPQPQSPPEAKSLSEHQSPPETKSLPEAQSPPAVRSLPLPQTQPVVRSSPEPQAPLEEKSLHPLEATSLPEPHPPLEATSLPEPHPPLEAKSLTEPQSPLEAKALPEPQSPLEAKVLPEPQSPLEAKALSESQSPPEAKSPPQPQSPPELESSPVPQFAHDNTIRTSLPTNMASTGQQSVLQDKEPVSLPSGQPITLNHSPASHIKETATVSPTTIFSDDIEPGQIDFGASASPEAEDWSSPLSDVPEDLRSPVLSSHASTYEHESEHEFIPEPEPAPTALGLQLSPSPTKTLRPLEPVPVPQDHSGAQEAMRSSTYPEHVALRSTVLSSLESDTTELSLNDDDYLNDEPLREATLSVDSTADLVQPLTPPPPAAEDGFDNVPLSAHASPAPPSRPGVTSLFGRVLTSVSSNKDVPTKDLAESPVAPDFAKDSSDKKESFFERMRSASTLESPKEATPPGEDSLPSEGKPPVESKSLSESKAASIFSRVMPEFAAAPQRTTSLQQDGNQETAATALSSAPPSVKEPPNEPARDHSSDGSSVKATRFFSSATSALGSFSLNISSSVGRHLEPSQPAAAEPAPAPVAATGTGGLSAGGSTGGWRSTVSSFLSPGRSGTGSSSGGASNHQTSPPKTPSPGPSRKPSTSGAFILNRIDSDKASQDRRTSQEAGGGERLREGFERVRNEMEGAARDIRRERARAPEFDVVPSTPNDESIDWQFWGAVVQDYEEVARARPKELSRAIQQGIPPVIRGPIWQLMSSSKSLRLEDTYKALLKLTSPHEKAIHKDLARTFPKHKFFQESQSANTVPGAGTGQESLFMVVKAYSLYDPEVGYTQGIAFIVAALLLNMPDEEAFCVLVRLMDSYNLRSHYMADMPGLQLRLYQFDRLVEDILPLLHNHLVRKGVKSSMFASQWFMTLFSYRFPLSLVYRVLDIVLAEGIEAVFRFAVALLRRSEDQLLRLEFEQILAFLQGDIYEVYRAPPSPAEERDNDFEDVPVGGSGYGNARTQSVGEEQWRANNFVRDAYDAHITPLMLDQYEAEWNEKCRAESARTREVEQLRHANRHLSSQVKTLEASLASMNQEHVELVRQLVMAKIAKEDMETELVRYKNLYAQLAQSQPNDIELTPARASALHSGYGSVVSLLSVGSKGDRDRDREHSLGSGRGSPTRP